VVIYYTTKWAQRRLQTVYKSPIEHIMHVSQAEHVSVARLERAEN